MKTKALFTFVNFIFTILHEHGTIGIIYELQLIREYEIMKGPLGGGVVL